MTRLWVVKAYRSEKTRELTALVPIYASIEASEHALIEETKRRLKTKVSEKEIEAMVFKVEQSET